ncbi:MAG: TnpV protein [Eubacteriales bacterium]|nr:TnpV protein [Eubacteriales bacterium]
MQSLFEEMGGTYTLGADGIYYPNLTLPEEEEPHYGKYGRMRKAYLQEHRKGLYTELLLTGKLVEHLNEVNDTANERMQLLTRQMAEKQHVDETLKARDQLAWVGAKNNIHNAAEEIVLNELIYI